MAKKLYEESNIQDIADAIREKNGSTGTYTTADMADAISDISTAFEVPANMSFAYSQFITLPNNITFEPRTSCYMMFAYCSFLSSTPLFDTSNVTDMEAMFMWCDGLLTVSSFDTSSVTNMSSTFEDCQAITSVPLFDTSNVTDMSRMFYECYEITAIPEFDMSSVTLMGNMFYECSSLTRDSLQNILKSLITATSYSGTKTLKYIGLDATQTAICAGIPEWSTLTSMGWSDGWVS